MRFAEPFTQSSKSPEAKLEAERLMFLELTQGLTLSLQIFICSLTLLCFD